jgi:hypothetical protein
MSEPYHGPIIDPHHHLWDLSMERHPWLQKAQKSSPLGPLAPILRDYGVEDLVPPGQPIPAHLLGNMWAQEWANVYSLVEPYPGVSDLDVSGALDRRRQQKLGEYIAQLGRSPSAEEMVEARRKADEWIALEQLERGTELFARAIRRFCT